jgi:hypothetical protein
VCAENSNAKVSATEVAVIHNKHLILDSLQSKGEKMSKSEPRKKPMQPKEPTLASHFCLSSLPIIWLSFYVPQCPIHIGTLIQSSHILHVPQCDPYPSSIPTYLSHHIARYCTMYSGMLPPWAKDPWWTFLRECASINGGMDERRRQSYVAWSVLVWCL